MTMTDPISDFLTRIRNGQKARMKVIESPYSQIRKNIADVLADEGYIRGVSVSFDTKGFKILRVELKYVDNKPVISMIKRVSSPGRRVYSPIAELSMVHNGLGMSVLSTNKGVMSDAQARKLRIGGEVLCRVF